MKIKVSNVNTPNWKEVTVKSRIPEELEKLSEIARNIWWAWNFEATELFRDLDPELWKECGQNPVLLLERMSYEKLEALAKDKVILRRMNEVYTKFRDYMDVITRMTGYDQDDIYEYMEGSFRDIMWEWSYLWLIMGGFISKYAGRIRPASLQSDMVRFPQLPSGISCGQLPQLPRQ